MNDLIKSVMFYVFLFGCGVAIVYLFSVVVFDTPSEVFQSPGEEVGNNAEEGLFDFDNGILVLAIFLFIFFVWKIYQFRKRKKRLRK